MRKKRKNLKQQESSTNHSKNEPHIRHDKKGQIGSDENHQEINPAKLDRFDFDSESSVANIRKAHQPYDI